ncbi:MAG: alpha/beta fold hydrolase [Azospirillaceae bacterium]
MTLPPPWSDLSARAAASDPAELAGALDREIARRSDRFFAGLRRYRDHPFRRALADPPSILDDGATRLLDYGEKGRPVLFVPSLVNRWYVLDLARNNSLARWLTGQGVRPLIVDWGAPDAHSRGFGLTEMIAGRLERALDTATDLAGGPVKVVGYCMGGLLATALATRRPDRVAGLALLATPWDFHAHSPTEAQRLAAAYRLWQPGVALLGELPVDAIQMLFASLDPFLALDKFTRLAGMSAEDPRVEAFVALEDWLNDGVALPARVAEECLVGWYGENRTARREWRVAGEIVDPSALDMPSLHLIPANDRIVPPESARALAAAMPGAAVATPPLGHIGMVVSSRGRREVWPKLASWLVG